VRALFSNNQMAVKLEAKTIHVQVDQQFHILNQVCYSFIKSMNFVSDTKINIPNNAPTALTHKAAIPSPFSLHKEYCALLFQDFFKDHLRQK